MSGGAREGEGPEGGAGGPGGGRGPAAPPNVKPKMVQKEEARRKEKRSRARRSVSSSSERPERSRRSRRSEEARGRRGRSEEARGRRDRAGGGESRAARPGDELEDTECAVCFCSYDNAFRTPKLLACGHTFCLECLARINVASAELTALRCPVCRELTALPHGRDLPRLGNNQDVIGRLPAAMRTARSVRFQRRRGKLRLKSPPRGAAAPGFFSLLKKKSPAAAAAAAAAVPAAGEGDLHLGALEQGIAPATVVDVGRPPSRVRGRLRRLFRSERCYYVVVAAIASVTVAIMLVGILAFVIIPRLSIYPTPPAHGGNQTLHGTPD